MAKRHSNPIVYQQSQAILKHLFGGYGLRIICFVIFALIFLSLSVNVLWVWIVDGFSQFTCEKNLTFVGILLAFVAMVLFGYFRAKRAGEAVGHISVIETKEVVACKVLIVFLSFPGKDLPLISNLIEKKVSEEKITDLQFRQQFCGGWRMLLEAIAYHLKDKRLEKVVILPSLETLEEMKRLKDLYSVIGDRSVEIIAAGDLLDNSKWKNGVHYEKATDLRNCLHDVYEQLKKEKDKEGKNRYMEENIIVDITSGQKVCSSVATVMSLAIGRQFQYISTHDYKARTFNICYQSDS